MGDHVGFGKYTELLRIRDVRRVVVLGLVIRIPLWAANIALVLHVVSHLHRSYVDAGLVAGVASLALAASGPWRGRRLDQRGLRATIGPALIVEAVSWSIAPWVGFWPLILLVLVSGVFVVPSFSIVRQVMIAAVPLKQRTAALSLDAVAVELSFMVGPVVGVLIATSIPTPIALMVCQFASVGGSLYLWWIDPPLQAAGSAAEQKARLPLRAWVTPAVLMILVLTLGSTIVLNAEDLAIVAALRHAGHGSWIGWELALWGGGSAVGGILYGAAHRHPPASWILLGLGVSTALVAVAPNIAIFTILLFISGLFCAPTITATVDSLSRAVPDSVRGEAIGWHGSALTVGGAIAAPIIGAMLDAHGWGSGFWLGGGIGAAIAVAAMLMLRERSALEAEGGEDLAGGLAAVERVEVQPRSAGG
ncbi:MAG: MFS transporter [Marmoricola sp.]